MCEGALSAGRASACLNERRTELCASKVRNRHELVLPVREAALGPTPTRALVVERAHPRLEESVARLWPSKDTWNHVRAAVPQVVRLKHFLAPAGTWEAILGFHGPCGPPSHGVWARLQGWGEQLARAAERERHGFVSALRVRAHGHNTRTADGSRRAGALPPVVQLQFGILGRARKTASIPLVTRSRHVENAAPCLGFCI
mmetsp:Transcript_57601/g.159363  ORF Transcript_57601/g.159363 Transcript_57601/m.159363 type:complete len:201 (+) Transcript_57601:1108-1710(+)